MYGLFCYIVYSKLIGTAAYEIQGVGANTRPFILLAHRPI
jgi:hypothetical protein